MDLICATATQFEFRLAGRERLHVFARLIRVSITDALRFESKLICAHQVFPLWASVWI